MNWKSVKKIEGLQVSGNYNYYLDFSVKGTPPYQSSIFSINAFTRPDQKIALAMKYKWYRVRGVRSYHLVGLNSNTYQFSAQDIGSVIQVEILPQEDEYIQSKVTARIGPIRMDPSIRSTLEGILSSGGSKFPVNIILDDTKFEQKHSGSLSLTSDYIKINSNMDSMRERFIKFKYSLESPLLEMNNLDSTVMSFVFKGDEEEYQDVIEFLGQTNRKTKERGCRIAFKFVSKNSRDLVVLALKCFAARNYLQMAKVINNIDTIFAEGKTFSDKAGDKNLTSGDLLLEIESIKKELYAVMDQNKELVQEKESFIDEVKRLEVEILETIETYTKLIDELRSAPGQVSNTTLKENESILLDLSVMGKKEDFESRKKLKQLQRENKDLVDRLDRMNEELELMRNFNKTDGFFSESRIWVKSDEMNSFLKIDSKKEKTKKGERRNDDGERIAELEKIKQDHIKHIHILENKLEESQKMLERLYKNDSSFTTYGNSSTSNPNLKSLESRLIETKRLNEILIEENKSLKKDVELMRNEHDKLRQNNGVNESLQQINKLNDEIYSDNIKMLETMLAESKKHGDDQREICKRLEKEKHMLLQEIGEYKMKLTALENELQHQRLLKGSVLYQSMYSSPGKDYGGTPNKDFASPLSTSQIIEKEEKLKRTEKDKSYLADEVSRLKSQLTQTEIELSKSRMQTERAESDFRNTKVKLENTELEMQFLKRENESYKNHGGGGHYIGNILTGTYNDSQKDIELKNIQTRYEVLKAELEKTKTELLTANTELERLKLRASSASLSTVSSPMQPSWNNQGDMELKNYELRSDNEKLRMENDRLKGELDSKSGGLAPDSYRNYGASGGMDAKTIASIQQLRLENESLRKELERLRKNEFNSSFALNRTMHFEMESENETLRSTVKTMEQALTDYKMKFEYAQKEINSLSNQLRNIKPMGNSNVLGQASNSAEDQLLIRQLEMRLAEARKTNEKLVMEIADLRSSNESLRREIDVLRMSTGSHDPNRSFQGSSFFINKTSALELENENESLRKNISSLEQMLSDYKKRIEQQQNEITVLTKKAASEALALQLEFEKVDLQTRLEYLKKENERLMKENDSLKNSKSILGNSIFHEPLNASFRDQREIESLKNENEMLVQQRNQISRRAESLAKELEALRNKPLSNTTSSGNQAMLENLLQTNQRLMQENAKLMEQIRRMNDEMDGVKSHASRMMDLSMSRMEPDQEVHVLKERIRNLQRENEAVSNEKDKLLVELSKIMAQDHY